MESWTGLTGLTRLVRLEGREEGVNYGYGREGADVIYLLSKIKWWESRDGLEWLG